MTEYHDMPESLKKKRDQAEELDGIPIDVGDIVICDICNKDFSNSDESGGFVFGSYGYGPCCAEKGLQSIKSFNEEKYIVAVCPQDKSFKQFIIDYRKETGSDYIQYNKGGE